MKYLLTIIITMSLSQTLMSQSSEEEERWYDKLPEQYNTYYAVAFLEPGKRLKDSQRFWYDDEDQVKYFLSHYGMQDPNDKDYPYLKVGAEARARFRKALDKAMKNTRKNELGSVRSFKTIMYSVSDNLPACEVLSDAILKLIDDRYEVSYGFSGVIWTILDRCDPNPSSYVGPKVHCPEIYQGAKTMFNEVLIKISTEWKNNRDIINYNLQRTVELRRKSLEQLLSGR